MMLNTIIINIIIKCVTLHMKYQYGDVKMISSIYSFLSLFVFVSFSPM